MVSGLRAVARKMHKHAIRKRHRRGLAVVEAALVLSVFFMLMLALFEYGRLTMIRQLLDSAAREGARQALVSTGTLTTQDIQNTVTQRMVGQSLQNMNVLVYKADPTTGANIGVWTDAGLGECIAVEVSGNYLPIVPKISLLPTSVPLKAKVVMYSEAN